MGKRAKSVIAWVLGGGLLLLVAVLAYHGAFTSVSVAESEAGPFVFVFRHAPETSFSLVRSVTDELADVLERGALRARKPAQVFYPAGDMDVGFLVEGASLEQLRAALGGSFELKELPRERFLETTFPFESPLSFFVAYFKVDPALRAAREAKGYAKTPVLVVNEGERVRYRQRIGS